MYRNKKLTESANGESCVNCGINNGTIVWAHSNQLIHGKGKGDKFAKRAQFLEWWEVSMIRACDRGYL